MFINLFEFTFQWGVYFVSPVNWCVELNTSALCKLVINKIKRRGPRADPWGVSYLIGFSVDLIPLNTKQLFYLLGKIGSNSHIAKSK